MLRSSCNTDDRSVTFAGWRRSPSQRMVRKGLGGPLAVSGPPVQPARPAQAAKLAPPIALACALLVPGAVCIWPHQASAQTAGSQVEMFLGASQGTKWTEIFSNHPRTSGTAPALTSCGTAPAIAGTDSAGTVTMGTGTPTGCVITFATAYAAAPHCVVTWQANLADQDYTVSTTAITLTQTATSSNLVNYICVARSGG